MAARSSVANVPVRGDVSPLSLATSVHESVAG